MQFVETKDVSLRSPRELKFVSYILWFEDLIEHRSNDELIRCLVVFLHDLCGQCLPQGKNRSSSRKTSSVSKEVVVHVRLHFTRTESRETNLAAESPSE